MPDAFEKYMNANNSGAWREWPANQIADARQDFTGGWNAAIDHLLKSAVHSNIEWLKANRIRESAGTE